MPTSSALFSAKGTDKPSLSSDLAGLQGTFYPEQDGAVWVVVEGQVDLFFQKMSGGEYGARHHIASIGKGSALFGIDTQAHGGLSLVAIPHPGTRLHQMSRPVFCRRNTLSSERSPGALLEKWIGALYAATALAAPPRDSVGVNVGKDLAAFAGVIAVTSEDSLCWLRLPGRAPEESGDETSDRPNEAPTLYGQQRLPSACTLIPLTRTGQPWLTVLPGKIAGVLSPSEIDLLDPAWEWMAAFHTVMVLCLLRRREQAELAWESSLRRQQTSDSMLAHHAMLRLAAPLAQAGKGAGPAGDQAEPLLVVCQVLGAELGIEFHAVPELRAVTSFRSRVEALTRAASVRYRRVTLAEDWWLEECGPLLATRKDDKRPLALVFRPPEHYQCFDPVEGSWSRVDATLAAGLSQGAYSLYPRFPLRVLGGRDLTRFILGASRNDLLLVLAMGTAGGLLSLIFPVFLGIIFDSVIPGADHGQLLTLSALLLATACASALFTLVRSLATLRIEARIDSAGQAAVWDRLLRLPAPFFRRFSSGDLAVRSLAINQIRVILTNSTLSSILSGIFSLFNLALLFVYSVPLALLAFGLTTLFLLISMAAALSQLKYARQVARLRGRISSTLLEFMNGIAKLRISGAERRAFAVWAHAFSRQKQLYLQARKAANRLFVLQAVYPILAMLALFVCASPLLTKRNTNALSTGSFLGFLAAFIQFIASSVQFTTAFPSIISIVPVFERCLPILQAAPEVAEGQSPPGELQGGLQVSHLSFRYDAGTPLILRDVSFEVRPGEFVAFTGPSGSGKSTLLRLLLGFETPESGSVAFDDQDIRGLDVQAVRQQIGVVLQSGRLVSGSILDNILGSLPLTQEDAWEAARMAGLDQDIKAMPMGLHTFVNDGGGGLSGGQRQRLMIARAIVNKPRILFFDEATSALDNYTQSVVCRSLEALRATRVVIAHRLSTIQHADRICVFDRGSIVQTGTYRELSSAPGLFQHLVQRQEVN